MIKEQFVQKRMGRLIAIQRKASALSQKEVAAELKIGAEAYSRIERGNVSPSIYRLYQLAEIFGCSVESFLLDASPVAKDQALRLERLISGVSKGDQKFVLTLITSLCKRFAKGKRGGQVKDDFLLPP